ncbi:3-phosphoshikimate 1-carboxyvinyltransferase [bacterium SCSIO 12741]|nr:3-phosphoshikimate 1-carboxyvinyltransferase [bacterium SCSIO 12741]
MKIVAPISPFEAEIQLPVSKSLMNRALVIQSLSGGRVKVAQLPDSDDTQKMQEALQNASDHIHCGDAGTVARFVLAAACTWNREVTLAGTEALQKRPMGPLVNALRQLGFSLDYLGKEGCLPIRINPQKANEIRPTVSIQADVSSQFITALLLIAPTLSQGLTLHLEGEPASRSYLEMTLNLLRKTGIQVEWKGSIIRVEPGAFKAQTLTVERDWSSAGYGFEMVALWPGSKIQFPDLSLDSLQGDTKMVPLFQRFGVIVTENEKGVHIFSKGNETAQVFDWDFSLIPDQAQTLMATLCGLYQEGFFRGLQTLPLKETNRISAMQIELAKIGARLREEGQGWKLYPGPVTDHTPHFKTYNDHRMAMSLAPLALTFGEVEIENPEVVHKSYPDYWRHLQQIGFKLIS